MCLCSKRTLRVWSRALRSPTSTVTVPATFSYSKGRGPACSGTRMPRSPGRFWSPGRRRCCSASRTPGRDPSPPRCAEAGGGCWTSSGSQRRRSSPLSKPSMPGRHPRREGETSMPLLRRVARVAAAGAVAGGAAGGGQHRPQGRRARQEEEQRAAQEQQQMAAAPPPPEENSMEQLKELGQLHESGVLTDEEFATAKSKILNA